MILKPTMRQNERFTLRFHGRERMRIAREKFEIAIDTAMTQLLVESASRKEVVRKRLTASSWPAEHEIFTKLVDTPNTLGRRYPFITRSDEQEGWSLHFIQELEYIDSRNLFSLGSIVCQIRQLATGEYLHRRGVPHSVYLCILQT